MKRMLIFMLAVLLMLTAAAMAEVPAEMRIVNCQEWVSLRAEPDSAAQRFAEVPLGAVVRGFYQSNGDFSQCEYEGVVGYILSQYLEVKGSEASYRMDGSEPSFELQLPDGPAYVWKGYGDVNETLFVARFDENGDEIWSYATESLGTTELDSLSVFVNDKAAQPMVMVYNSYYGLVALDAATGAEIWTLPVTEVSLGGSIKYAVGDDGAMYIGGYYGPDPVAISADGKVLWQATQTDTYFYWISNITPADGGVIVTYEGEPAAIATYDAQGNMTGHEPAPIA